MNAMRLRRILASVVLLLTGCVCHAQAWVDDWFTSSSTTQAGSFETQTRGYYTGGSFQGRWRMSNDYLLSVQPPKIKTGCGGVDLFGGGMSYLDADYLVEKFQRIIQAAPAMAFDLALQHLCKPCVAAMETLEDLSSQLNSIQVNDCRMAQRLVQSVQEGDPSVIIEDQRRALADYSISESYYRNLAEVNSRTQSSNGAAPIDTRPMLSSCPQVFLDVFGGGSVIQNTAELVGLESYADLMRGLIGDVVVTFPNGQNAPSVETMQKCDGNDDIDAEDFMTGTVEVKATNERCSSAGFTPVADIVRTRLEGIVARMQTATALTPPDLAFINESPIPVYALLRDGVVNGTSAQTVQMLSEPLALAYAHRILDDLYKATQTVVSNATEVSSDASTSTGSTHRCEVAFLRGGLNHIAGMMEGAKKYRAMAQVNYQKRLQELMAHLEYSKLLYEQRKQALNKISAGAE